MADRAERMARTQAVPMPDDPRLDFYAATIEDFRRVTASEDVVARLVALQRDHDRIRSTKQLERELRDQLDIGPVLAGKVVAAFKIVRKRKGG